MVSLCVALVSVIVTKFTMGRLTVVTRKLSTVIGAVEFVRSVNSGGTTKPFVLKSTENRVTLMAMIRLECRLCGVDEVTGIFPGLK